MAEQPLPKIKLTFVPKGVVILPHNKFHAVYMPYDEVVEMYIDGLTQAFCFELSHGKLVQVDCSNGAECIDEIFKKWVAYLSKDQVLEKIERHLRALAENIEFSAEHGKEAKAAIARLENGDYEIKD